MPPEETGHAVIRLQQPVKHLLLMPPNWLGDAVMAQPAMRDIVAALPAEAVTVCGRPWLKELLPYLGLGAAAYSATLPRADAAFLFPNSFRAAWQAFTSGSRQRIGYRGQWRRLLLTHPLPARIKLQSEHHRLYYLDMLEQLGIPVSGHEVSLSVPAGDAEAGMALIQQRGLDPARAFCVAPGAQFGGAKRYLPESYAQILRDLAAEGWQPVVLGTAAEREIAGQTLGQVAGPSWNAAGETSLHQALQLVAACRLMLCNDSGLMHVAAGIGKPTVALFGATDPERTAPSGPRLRVIYQPAHCSPCLQRECTVPGHPCMVNIAPTMVRDECLELLRA